MDVTEIRNSGPLTMGSRVSVDFRMEWHGPLMISIINAAMLTRSKMAENHLKSKIVSNISTPVTGRVNRTWTRSGNTGRSRPGEFPRAETRRLMGSIVSTVDIAGPGIYDVSVGSTASYATPLELAMDRSFLKRTMEEETQQILAILSRPITGIEGF